MPILKRGFAITLILVITLSLTGCWNRRELSTLGIIGLVGVDTTGNNDIKSTFEIIKPEKTSKGAGDKTQTPVTYMQANGSTLIESFRAVPVRFERKLFVSHAKGFLFSEEVARKGLAENLDMILRDHELRLTMHLIIVKDSTASDAMSVAGGINTIPSSYIEDLAKQYKVHSTSVDTTVLDFLKSYYSKGINPLVTVLKKVKKDKVGKSDQDEYELSVEGSAIFLKDKLIGFLDGLETRGYNWIVGKVSSGVVTFPTPNSNGLTSVEIFQAGSKRDVEIDGNDIKIKIKINMNGMLDEQTTAIKLTDPSVIEILEQATSQAIKQEVEHTLQKVQKEYKSDVFGFGQIVHRKYPQQWKSMQDNWDESFSQASFEVETEAKITKTGKSTLPVKE